MATKDVGQPANVLLPLCKRLVCSDPKLRLKAYIAVKRVLTRTSAAGNNAGSNNDNVWSSASLLAVWKALHYMLWMQDQPLLHEDVIERLVALVLGFSGADCSVSRWKLVRAFWTTQSREWHTLDYWRTDKFLLLVRRVLGACLQMLLAVDWAPEDVVQFREGIVEELILSDVKGALGLRLHVADLLVEELSDAKAPLIVVHGLLEPYMNLMGKLRHDTAEFVAIKGRVFEQLVDQAYYLAEQQQQEEEDTKNAEDDLEINTLQVDYGLLADGLFDVGCRTEVRGPARRQIYELVRVFRTIAAGEMLPEEVTVLAAQESSPSAKTLGISSRDIHAAVDRLEQREAAFQRRNKKNKCAKKTKLSAAALPEDKKKKKKKKRLNSAEKEDCATDSSSCVDATASAMEVEAQDSTSPTPPSTDNAAAAVALLPNLTDIHKLEDSAAVAAPPSLPCPRRRISFGKIYRKPFKKKDIVCTPSPAEKRQGPGRSILKAKDLSSAGALLALNCSSTLASRKQRRRKSLHHGPKSL